MEINKYLLSLLPEKKEVQANTVVGEGEVLIKGYNQCLEEVQSILSKIELCPKKIEKIIQKHMFGGKAIYAKDCAKTISSTNILRRKE